MFIKLLINNIRNWNKKVLTILFLSLILGEASIVGLFITLETFKKFIELGMESLGANRIVLWNEYDDPQRREMRDIPYEDILRLKGCCPAIKSLGCAYRGGGGKELILLKNKRKILDILNTGVSPSFAEVMGFKVKKGRFIEPKDEDKNVCVLPEDIANKLNADIGDRLKYSGTRVSFDKNTGKVELLNKEKVKTEMWTYYFKVIGIIKIPEVLYIIYHYPVVNKDPGIIYVPAKTKKLLRLYDVTWNDNLKVNDRYMGETYIKVSNIEEGIRQIQAFLKAKYGRDKIFSISKDEFLSNKLKDIQRVWTLLLGIIGIGGLVMGTANIFFTFLSFASTRKREIGIKRACGSKREDICKEFLAEGIVIILPPILIGAGLGVILSKIFLKTPVVSLDIIIACIGLFFCFSLLALVYPAIRASFIPPALAIRE